MSIVKILRTAILFLILEINAARGVAQSSDNFYVSPAFTIGYTFAGGFAIGYDVDFGIWRDYMSADREFNTGLSYHSLWTQAYYDRWHHIRSINFMMETDYYDAKVGLGYVVDKHGYNHIVHCWAPGFYTDISFTNNEVYFPWIGMQGFWYNWSYFEGFEYPYVTPYVKYKYDFLQQSGIKNFN
ncbi:MAG TPA: hypothetical protein PLL28_07825 [Chitinophagales bacterium]|nr:hypothetical protein [Chitinophagales bacterium]